MKRIKYGKEPVLHAHRYVVCVYFKNGQRWFHEQNLKEVRSRIMLQRKGSVCEVYEAHHNFREAWQK